MGKSRDPMRLTRHVQGLLHTRWGGYAPPTSCTLIPLPSDVCGRDKNPWSASVLAVVPTMRVPENVSWHKDLVYNSMWSLLAEISLWNRAKSDSERIKRVLMTGLGTGVGKVDKQVCADQMILAVKHWVETLPEEVDWSDVMARAKEVQDTIIDPPFKAK